MADSRVADLWYSDEKKSKRGVIIDKEEVRRASLSRRFAPGGQLQ